MTNKIRTRKVIRPRTVADNDVVRTTLAATAFLHQDGSPDFTATTLSQGQINATTYNCVAPGSGTHVGVAAHGVVEVDITLDRLGFGPEITVRTGSGQTLRINLFPVGAGNADMVAPVITLDGVVVATAVATVEEPAPQLLDA